MYRPERVRDLVCELYSVANGRGIDENRCDRVVCARRDAKKPILVSLRETVRIHKRHDVWRHGRARDVARRVSVAGCDGQRRVQV